MYDYFELVDESSVEDGEVMVVHFDNIEGDMFYSWVSGVTEGY